MPHHGAPWSSRKTFLSWTSQHISVLGILPSQWLLLLPTFLCQPQPLLPSSLAASLWSTLKLRRFLLFISILLFRQFSPNPMTSKDHVNGEESQIAPPALIPIPGSYVQLLNISIWVSKKNLDVTNLIFALHLDICFSHNFSHISRWQLHLIVTWVKNFRVILDSYFLSHLTFTPSASPVLPS